VIYSLRFGAFPSINLVGIVGIPLKSCIVSSIKEILNDCAALDSGPKGRPSLEMRWNLLMGYALQIYNKKIDIVAILRYRDL
jgi:hypothetical protein